MINEPKKSERGNPVRKPKRKVRNVMPVNK